MDGWTIVKKRNKRAARPCPQVESDDARMSYTYRLTVATRLGEILLPGVPRREYKFEHLNKLQRELCGTYFTCLCCDRIDVEKLCAKMLIDFTKYTCTGDYCVCCIDFTY